MKEISEAQLGYINGGDGLTFLNDAARALGGMVAGAVDAIQTEANYQGARLKAALINSAYE